MSDDITIEIEENCVEIEGVDSCVDVTIAGGVGPAGSAATVSVGTVTTGAAGSAATVTNVGTASAAVFNFSIPQGAAGAGVADGSKGDITVSGNSWTINANAVTETDLSSSAKNLIFPPFFFC